MTDSPPLCAAGKPPAATRSIHREFIEKTVPQWLVDATPARRSALENTPSVLPQEYKKFSPAHRKAVNASVKASAAAQVQLDSTMSTFLDVDAFARPLLVKALKDQHQVEVDVDKTFLCLRRALAVSVLEVEVASFELLKLSMLQAALHNFEAWECEAGAYHNTSGYVLETATAGNYEPTTVNLTVSQFMTLCRSLDIGAQYQIYLKAFFAPVDASPIPPLRQHFIASQKATLQAAADYAVATGDIEVADHAMIVSVINGSLYPTLGNKKVWLLDMSLMGKRLTGCVYFAIGDQHSDALILYIPHDPAHPLKRYTKQQMRDEFKRLFTARAGMAADDPAPTPYQQFFSQFVAYDQRPRYFSQFTQKSADSPVDPLSSPWRSAVEFLLGLSKILRIKELPPAKPAKMEPVADPYLAPGSMMPFRSGGTYSGLLDLWPFLYEKHRDKVLADARAHAVPTADVDVKAREAKLAHLLEVGMLALNLVSMFVPVLGEVMLAVMAEQLLSETVAGSIEWAEGDKLAAKEHLIDVAENLAQIALMAGVGTAVSRFRAANAVPVLENLSPVTLPNGETRLWKPDLTGYQSPDTLDAGTAPNALGQYTLNGKTYMRQGGQLYEQVFDESIQRWRIKHPTNADAYQPVLHSNNRGAWRHSLERPLEWDRLTLLRRMGHTTEGFSDTELIKVADVSGVSDNALRKMHMDHAAPPPELTDAMRLFKADADSGQVIEQLRGSQPIDERYLFALPLVAQMPRWPKGRVLEVFKGAELSGDSLKYGSEHAPRGAVAKTPIQITRADVLGGRLPAVILAALEEPQVNYLLGRESARVRDLRPQELGKQLADFAQARKAAIFDSLYAGTEPVDSQVSRLQRVCPGLSEAGAQDVLADARPDDLEQLHATGRVPLTLLEEARWYARQGRQTRAYAGLRSETMALRDSRRLALHTLEKLPGWPQTLRLEIREDSGSGPLLDSIGSDSARDKRYLVKKGPRFQAFNERGEELNSLPTQGDNFYASLMHSMPDEARQALGVPHVGQSAQLQEKIIEAADLHRSETAQLLEPQRQWFKPPVRINDKQVGYYASGRSPGLRANLAARARALYPELSDEQATGYIRQLQQSKTDSAILTLLQNRGREYAAFASALDQWVGQPPVAADPFSGTPDSSAYRHKTQVAQMFKALWGRAALAGEVSFSDRLAIMINEPLPPLTTDFPHIRELSVGGRGMNDANADSFLARFPDVETLSIGENGRVWNSSLLGRPSLTTVPVAVSAMPKLKSLTFKADAGTLAADFSSKLNALTALEELHIHCTGFSPTALNKLDLSALVKLKKLQFDAPHTLSQWPAYVEGFTQLERLDLTNTSIRALPERLYDGYEKLWAGLSLDWSKFPREAFKPAYEYVRNYRGGSRHLADLNQMVSGYASGELQALMGSSLQTTALSENIMATWDTPETRFAAIEALGVEQSGLFGAFYGPATPELRFRSRLSPWQSGQNAEVISALETSWRGAVAQRYGGQADVSVFELPAQDVQVIAPLYPGKAVTLPALPAGTFSHVRTLRLGWSGESTAQTRSFIRAFSGTQTLELNGLGLSEIPIGADDLPNLTRLDLANNGLVATPAVQAQLNGLGSLELLDLGNNSLNGLDVSALTQLKVLNLRGTRLQGWPTGAETLPQLNWLDLRDNQIATLPSPVLANDALLMKVNLAGNRFSPTGEAALKSARQRVENAQGLPEGTLQRFEQEVVPAVFAPQETDQSMARYLLPLPEPVAGPQGVAGYAKRLQQLHPALTEEQALQRLAQLRKDGMSDAQIDVQLNSGYAQYASLTRQLNGWLYTRELHGPDVSVVAQERQMVAIKIRECWQGGLAAEPAAELSLHGLQADTLPALDLPFAHVQTLDLTGVRVSAHGADGFLNSFPALRRLVLGGNDLTAVPQAVARMDQLEQLELSANAISDPEPLYRQLGGARLRRLDLSHNSLSEFSTRAFSGLQTLDLSYNGITHWPDGALEATHLTSLNLSGNTLTMFPDRLLDGNHDPLVLGLDLTDNHRLSLNSFEQLRHYSDTHQGGGVAGFTRPDIDSRIAALESDSEADSSSGSSDDSDGDSDGDGGEPLEVIPDLTDETGDAAAQSWLVNTPAALAASRRQWWRQLAQESGHGPFFHLLSQLRYTHEYRYTRADLTRRVWDVIEVAAASAQQRRSLFQASKTHSTCIDGRILSFSEVEVLVFEARVLEGVPAHNLRLKGQRLLDLSRQLFRLDQVDLLAGANARGQDPAEARLEYRIGMTRGWPDRLELPGQPSYMAFGTPLSGAAVTAARASVLAAEASDGFYESLIAREYWLNYLRERYPDAFEALEQNAATRQGALEDEHSARELGTESQERYIVALNLLEIELGSARAQKLLELSRREVADLSAGRVATSPPGSGSPKPGPSSRP
ncbi:dermonecrotic toxin domain-containing protein [Pseudomonas fluorescens]|uniref:RING-type E3 ubiquitin transferase n=1 Tax=Pseudomonas fluorescens TaxID=294 RepID=A0A2N1E0R0_PSEFL|nr:DUF6543 domain-containing protein [Pseudomonas fluorescens]PKH17978.1 hypothetical protein CIB54_19715 [Pseudomonas fluorescens]